MNAAARLDGNTYWSRDGESFTASSLDELLELGDELKPGDVVEFGTAEYPGTDFIGAGDCIELIGDRASDVGGEWAEDFPHVSDEARAELDAFLEQWQAKHCQPTFYSIVGAQEYTLTEADFADTAKAST